MKHPIETARSFVNSWECDENVHMNIQFYWKRFGDAEQIFHQLSGSKSQQWTDRHVRYHAELGMGANIVIRSAALAEGRQIVHLMDNGDTGQLSATAIDQYDDTVNAGTDAVEAIPEQAEPRSLPSEAIEPLDTRLILKLQTGLVSHRSVITPQECDQNGQLLDQYHIARFSDAASHFWQHLGVSRGWLNLNNQGSVAVEMKASRHHAAMVGMGLQVTTWLEQVREKTLTFRHQVEELRSGKPLYSGAVTALLMDLQRRKAISLPDIIMNQASGTQR